MPSSDSGKTSSFEKLLEKDGSVTIDTGNFQTLAIEMFKVYKNMSQAIIAHIFHIWQNNYNLKHNSYFAIPAVKSVCHGTESLSNLRPRKKNIRNWFASDRVRTCFLFFWSARVLVIDIQ